MKNNKDDIRYLLGVAKNEPERELGFVIAYPDECGETIYVNELGEPLPKAPEKMTVVRARDKKQADSCLFLNDFMRDSIVIGDAGQDTDNMALIKVAEGFCISI